MGIVLEIISTDKTLFSGEVDLVVLPSAEGEMGVEPGHSPMLVALIIGEVRLLDAAGSRKESYATSDGFAQVTPEKLTVLVSSAEDVDEIDSGRAQAAFERAQHRLAKGDEIDVVRAQAALARALNRLRLAGR